MVTFPEEREDMVKISDGQEDCRIKCPQKLSLDCKTVYGASAEVIGKGIEKIIGQIRTILPETRILLISPILLGNEVWKTEYDPEFNKESVLVSKN